MCGLSLGHLFVLSSFTKVAKVTKPIVVVQMPCKLSTYMIQVEGFLIKGFYFLISKFLITYNIV